MTKQEIIDTLKRILDVDLVIEDDAVYNHLSDALQELEGEENEEENN